MDVIQPMHVLLLGAIFCVTLFWVLLIVGVVALVRRRGKRNVV